jgi:hypothetical protein
VALYPDNTVTPEPAELTVTKAYLRFAKDDAPEDSEAQQAYADTGGPQCPGEDKDLLRVRGTMDLAEDSDGIDPLSEAVTLSAGIHSVQVPAGSFRWWSKEDAYGYAGDYNGGRVWILLRELSAYEDLWEFRAGFKGIDNSGMSNPMAVTLSIGDDRGQTEVKLFGSLRYVAP